MTAPAPLDPERLYRHCNADALRFASTDELEDLPSLVGQDRAREAIELAVGVRRRGYNLYVLGPSGLGKRTLVEALLAARATTQAQPEDWCYVNNFEQPHRPLALRLPAGRGARLRQDMQRLVEELRASVPAMFDSEEYRSRVEQIDAQLGEQQEQLFVDLGQEAARHDIALIHTPSGFSLAPMQKGEVLGPEEYEKLPEPERERLHKELADLQDRLMRAVRQAHQIQKQKRSRIKLLNREMTMVAVGAQIEELKHDYAAEPRILAYLDAVQADVLENIDAFRRSPEAETNVLGMPVGEPPALRRYRVNVLVGDGRTEGGAPVVVEDYPTHPNLLGRVEHIAQFGTLVTDFLLIRPGALHRANGGYLLLDAYKLLTQPFAWEGLKRALASGELRLESLGQALGLISTVELEPEPIPLDLKVVLFGDRMVYYLLLALDPEFGELFRVAADFDDDLPRSGDLEQSYARLIATLVHREKLLPFEREAVARLIEEAARWAGDNERISAHLEALSDALGEADHWARQQGAQRVAAEHVSRAIAARERRASRVRERLLEVIDRGELFIDTAGARVGQINGLSVSQLGQYAFGHPIRITATTRLGDGEVIDIQREVELGGPIHSKGVLILSSFLASRYSAERPHSLAASLVFEQTYGQVEGDSASLAELAALMSSLGGLPIRQSLAVTGSVNQHGEVQPIGGVNEKIEGFFAVCERRGLDGSHGVLIPEANVRHLMLREAVVEAVRAGRFAIYPVRTVDEALELLTGLPPGEQDAEGEWSEGSVNDRVASRLVEFSLLRQAYASMQVKVKKVRGPGREPETPKKPPRPPKPPRRPDQDG